MRNKITMFVLVVLCLTGCSSNGTNKLEDIQQQVNSYIASSESQTAITLNATTGSKHDAASTFANKISVSYTLEEEKGSAKISAKMQIPKVSSVQESLASSDNFKAEYAAVEDKDTCLYDYATNALITMSDEDFNTVELSATSATVESAISDLQHQIDTEMQKALSNFMLATLYSETESVLPQEPILAIDLSDFVVLLHKHKILVSNVQVFSGEEAKSKLVALSEANTNLQLNKDDELYVVSYDMTNLSKKTISLSNMFCIGDQNYHLYSTSGFHIEGLTPPTKVKYGVTQHYTTAFVGGMASALYFYDASLKGARCWKEVPAL